MVPILEAEEREFLRTRKLIRELISDSVVRAKLLEVGDGRLYNDVLPYVTPTVPFDPVTRSIMDCWLENRFKTVNTVEYESEQAVGEESVIAVPAGETWEVVEIIGTGQMDGNAANRQCIITVDGHVIAHLDPAPGAVVEFAATTGVTLTLGLQGGSILTAGFAPNLITNLAGVLAVVADENPLPLFLNGGAIIAHDPGATVQVGDIMEVGVHYRRVA